MAHYKKNYFRVQMNWQQLINAGKLCLCEILKLSGLLQFWRQNINIRLTEPKYQWETVSSDIVPPSLISVVPAGAAWFFLKRIASHSALEMRTYLYTYMGRVSIRYDFFFLPAPHQNIYSCWKCIRSKDWGQVLLL